MPTFNSSMPFLKPWAKPMPSQVYDPLDEDEDAEKRQGSQSPGDTYTQPPKRRRPVLIYTIIGLSVANLLCLLLSIFLNSGRGGGSGGEALCSTAGAEVKKSIVPNFPLSTTVSFEQQWVFIAPPSPSTDTAWESLVPGGRGYVFVEDPEKYHLRPGVTTEYGIDIYSISMFHQLHCLNLIRKTYWKFVYGIYEKVDLAGLQDEAFEQIDNNHYRHCFDYIRQSIMCSGDMTVESARIETDGQRYQVDGWGITHQCKDWDSMWSFMMDNKFNGTLRHPHMP